MHTCKITFHPGNLEVTVPDGTDLLTAAAAADIQLYNGCGGEGICGECRVRVRSGEVENASNGRLTEAQREAGYVLACRTTVRADVQVEVPPESRIEREQILTDGVGQNGSVSRVIEVKKRGEPKEGEPPGDSPFSSKRFFRLTPPSLSDNAGDLDRLYREIRRREKIPHLRAAPDLLRSLGRVLRESDWQVTVTLAHRDGVAEIVRIEPGDTSGQNYGLAIDIGTTTLVAGLVDLAGGRLLGARAIRNPQRNYGEDVIARLIYAEKKDGLEILRRTVVDAINGLIRAVANENSIAPDDITGLTCAGNTTMIHLLLGIDPYYLRREPYVPAAGAPPVMRASEAGIHIHPHGLMACLPGVASYVGGDITAGVIAGGLHAAEHPSMLIDIGTNGEIVLGNRDWLVCCSASAGPAFEGSGVQCGMRAMEGAIQRVDIRPADGEPVCATVGGARPIGICGSGYIDLLSEMFRTGLLDRQGAIRISGDRARQGENGPEYVLVWAEETETGHAATRAPERFLSHDFRLATDIVVTQSDINNLIRTKGSIYSAAKVLVDMTGMSVQDIHKIYIGGGFGNYLNIEKAIRIGLLPDLPPDRFEFIGNSSLAGARAVLSSREAFEQAQEIAGRMTNIELCAEPSYMEEYVSSLFLPHTDIDLFPTVKQALEE